MTIRRLCVYCGSSPGTDPRYAKAAAELGKGMAAASIELVFGGGRVGLMGVVADAVLGAGGRVIGIIPGLLRDAELAHPGVTELITVGSMHERKRLMAERADAFAVMPGGLGTLDEAFEIVTWRQLKLHDKPIFVVDIAGYWAPFTALLDHIAAQGFVHPVEPRLLQRVSDVPELLTALRQIAASTSQHLEAT
ncbi:MAG: TIGR00730 family Rossman fold protein [Alphaproteobacteria bacterium]|nr:TIGR00730 family Rossman fold protein [Alphaproteobacteria bacterium]